MAPSDDSGATDLIESLIVRRLAEAPPKDSSDLSPATSLVAGVLSVPTDDGAIQLRLAGPMVGPELSRSTESLRLAETSGAVGGPYTRVAESVDRSLREPRVLVDGPESSSRLLARASPPTNNAAARAVATSA
ncbi:MAG: hypothetical protein WCK05_00005 [Planctomycetota bacterium]